MMLKSELLAAIRHEIYRHDWSQFVDELPTIAQGGRGVVMPGCPTCRVRINTMGEFLDHLANAMPTLLESLISNPNNRQR
jgi:hypothetical protein